MAESLSCDHCGQDYEYDSSDRRGHRKYACASCKVKAQRLRRKRELVEEFGGACEKCGYDECMRSLTFHHINPENKEFAVNSSNLKRAWDDVMREANKCKLLCANCHNQIHCDECSGFDL